MTMKDPSSNNKEPVQKKKRRRRIDMQEQQEQQQQQYTIHNLHPELIGLSLSFLGVGHFRYGPLACKMLLKPYLATVSNDEKITSGESITLSISCAKKYFDDMNIPDGTRIQNMEKQEWDKEEELERKLLFFWNNAAKYGRLEVMEWGHQQGYSHVWKYWLEKRDWDEWYDEDDDVSPYANAVKYGQLDALKWLKERGCPFPSCNLICKLAAESGHLPILQWLRETGTPWDADTCSSAAKKGHFSILKWARENGCPWDEVTYRKAQRSANPAIIEYVIAQGCPGAPRMDTEGTL